MIKDSQLKQLVEAALFAANEAITLDQLMQGALSGYKLNRPRLRQILDELIADYQERGVQLVEVASGYRFQTRAELAPALANMWQERSPRYSAALLETLALIAWRQPVTRGEIEAVRGVSVSTQIMRTLQERGWVKVVGQKEVPGRPSLYATTKAFLDYFSLQSIADLPALAAERPELEALAEPQAADHEPDTRERGETKATLH
ncbi:SMC-Scp complex subunit ScpB [Aliidiomarina sedimenti]|uniref:SMC-Scp complex subunit ScpB n=1 Tax=Aliidiomarina sedimenti TaxID=1933879 RepID=A0ABY0BWZ0_9GAMM|nr:SMC-Scp complex subunit ScpB [Aliidiomarina sedimenti]RUO28874.1 SMC-Scp complex subunit ScpB [Aliidiomarina sedimenti]